MQARSEAAAHAAVSTGTAHRCGCSEDCEVHGIKTASHAPTLHQTRRQPPNDPPLSKYLRHSALCAQDRVVVSMRCSCAPRRCGAWRPVPVGHACQGCSCTRGPAVCRRSHLILQGYKASPHVLGIGQRAGVAVVGHGVVLLSVSTGAGSETRTTGFTRSDATASTPFIPPSSYSV